MKPSHKLARKSKLSVAVMLDLYRYEEAGGHVKSWERLAEAVTPADGLDLTVYSLGQHLRTFEVNQAARHVTLPPVLGTDRLAFLDGIADHTDLAPFHPELWLRLDRHDVLHTTDAFFAMARTALRFARRANRPLVTSLHTDTPGYTRVYAEQVLHKLLGNSRIGSWFTAHFRLPEQFGAKKAKQLARYLNQCDWVLTSPDGYAGSQGVPLPVRRTSVLRRGIDKNFFHPQKRDRDRLSQIYGIAADKFVLLYAGRLTPDKQVVLLARAVRHLLEQGERIHAVFAGRGNQQVQLRDILGSHVTLPGPLSQSELAWLYASADIFALPSELEIFPNVVVEAKASGLPVVVSSRGGSARLIERPGEDGLVVSSSDERAWAEALRVLLRDAGRRQAMGKAARQQIETRWPSWRDVLREDLLPVWERVSAEHAK
jgi:glycosyltransferase involved in cell wall biosynthesis